MNIRLQRSALLVILAAAAWLAGCAATVRPAELLRADGLLTDRAAAAQATSGATVVYGESRKQYARAVQAFLDDDMDECVHFATLATLRFETAREMTARQAAEERLSSAERRREVAGKNTRIQQAKLDDLNRRIARMEKILALQADSKRFAKAQAEERAKREVEQKAAEQKAAADRQAAEAEMALMRATQTAQAAIAGADSQVQTAEALGADKVDPQNMDAAKIELQKARLAFDQKKFQDVPALAKAATAKAEAAIAAANKKFAEENEKVALLKEREALFADATAIDGLTARTESRGVVLTLTDLFPSSKTTIMPEQAYLLDKIAALAKKYPRYPVVVEGYTDSRGRDAENLALSQGRAQSVLDYLVQQHKFPFDRMRSSGYGEANPVADNSSAEGRAKNRRVEAILLFR